MPRPEVPSRLSPRFDRSALGFEGMGQELPTADSAGGSSPPAASSCGTIANPGSGELAGPAARTGCWQHVPMLGRRSQSPQRPSSSTTDLVCSPVSWDDAAGGEHGDWVRNAKLIDPCFHHPRSAFSRSVNADIEEESMRLHHSPPLDVATTDDRWRLHREAAQVPFQQPELSEALSPQQNEPQSQHPIFQMDDEQSGSEDRCQTMSSAPEVVPRQGRHGDEAMERIATQVVPKPRYDDETVGEMESLSRSVPLPIPVARACKQGEVMELEPSPVFASSGQDL